MGTLKHHEVHKLSEPGRYGDGDGLYMSVATGGSKSWVLRVRIDGRRVDRGLGGFPKVSLSAARKTAREYRAAIRKGVDPWATEPAAEPEPEPTPTPRSNAAPTFAEMAREVYRARIEGLRASDTRWIARLEKHIFPVIGDRPVNEITRADLVAILNPLKRSQFETARKTKQSLYRVFRRAVALDHCMVNVADDALDELLDDVQHEVTHFKALHHSDVKTAIRKIRNSEARASTKLCFEFLILTMVRSGEARHATWSEIQGDTWVIPAARMKGKRDHTVPLSYQAQAVLRKARELYREPDDCEFDWPVDVSPDAIIFPHPGSHKALSENALSDRAKKSRLNCHPHGFRSSARDWLAETYGDEYETAAEICLAHYPGTEVVKAYRRTGLDETRREMLQRWADYTDPVPPPF